jgi:hypothetical protein
VGIEELQELLTLHLRVYRWPCSRVSRGKVRRLTVWRRVLIGARQTVRQSCDGRQHMRWRRLLRLMVFVFLLVGHVVRVCQENVVWQIRAQRRSVQSENGIHERRLRRMVLTSDGREERTTNIKICFCAVEPWVTCLR